MKFKEGMRCGNCNGEGKVWVTIGIEDVERELCEHCDGTGQVWSSEYEKDKATGRLE